MTPPDVLSITAACWIVAAMASLRIAPPQLLLLIRTCTHRDDLWLYRLKTSLLFGSLAVALLRNAAVWADFVWFDMRYFGSIADRRLGDLVVSVAIMLACLLAAGLYSREQRRSAGERP
jgi:hypothetical protein